MLGVVSGGPNPPLRARAMTDTPPPCSCSFFQTRLDINAPDFTAYKKTYPGLFK
jgi:hypothetical protein